MRKLILFLSLVFFYSISYGQVAADSASNYLNWTNTSNAGVGFGNWNLWNTGTSGHFLSSSTSTHGNVDSDNGSGGTAFGMYGHSGINYANAQRGFDYTIAATNYTELQDGHTFSIELATAYRNGNKGVDIFQTDFTNVFNFNVGSNDYTALGATLGWAYDQNSVINLEVTQVNATSILVRLKRGTDIYGPVAITTTGRIGYFKCYVGETDNSSGENNFYFNNIEIRTNNPLPVELKSFKAFKKDNKVVLDWITLSEENNAGFEIQKSIDGKTFEVIGFVDGNGSSLEEIQYQFLDNKPTIGKNYYRLKQLDFDGIFEFTNIVVVDYFQDIIMKLYPNPTTDKVVLYTQIPTTEFKIELHSINGQVVYEEISIIDNETSIDLSNLKNGIYYLTLSQNGQLILNEQLIKN